MSAAPTMAELGIGDDPLIRNFFGLAAPAGTPRRSSSD
jgi:tripartite-type tricarboxylate transporter receptor subunit TctC